MALLDKRSTSAATCPGLSLVVLVATGLLCVVGLSMDVAAASPRYVAMYVAT